MDWTIGALESVGVPFADAFRFTLHVRAAVWFHSGESPYFGGT
jgi:hypothetical protein